MNKYKQVLDFDVSCPKCQNPMVWIRPESYDEESELLPMFHICSYCHLCLQDGVGKLRSFSTARFSEHRYCDCGERIAIAYVADRCRYCTFAVNIHKDPSTQTGVIVEGKEESVLCDGGEGQTKPQWDIEEILKREG